MSSKSGGVLSSGGAKMIAVILTFFSLVLGGILGVVLRQPAVGMQVVLEPINKVPKDSWIPDGIEVAESDPEAVGTQFAAFEPNSSVPDDRASGTPATLSGREISGGARGVYGGSRDSQVCDKEQLVVFLRDADNAKLAEQWASILTLDASQIANYIAGLTGARLRWDSRVTDSGFKNAQSTTWQAVLQAGTAVLVDNTGVPRVKCNSGAPLLGPVALAKGSERALSVKEMAQNPIDAWEHLDPEQTVTINPSEQTLQTLNIVDVDEGSMLQRDIGSDGGSSRDVGSGDVQFNLKWMSRADLDLHVVDPEGNTYGYEGDFYASDEGDNTSPNGGQHDVDSNIGCDDERDENGFAKENIFWPPGDAPSGEYQVFVKGYTVSDCDPPQSGSFVLTVTIGGEVKTFTGVVGEGESSEEWFFTK